MTYENLSPYEKALGNFADKVAIIAGLEINDKILPEEAHQQVKALYQELKSLRKIEKSTW
jgi:hypothetical protein